LFLNVVLLLLMLILLIAVYTIGPYAWGLSLRKVIWRGNSRGSRIAITFDDGPDPRYTPRCLEVLKAHSVRATFFVIGEKVKMHPDLVRQIVAQGHDVGSHTWSHQHHWSIGPVKSMQDVQKGNAEVAAAIGHTPGYFRPSYGLMNFFTYWQARRQRQRCVLWSIAGKDWQGGAGGRTAETIVATVSSSLKNGSIVLLHDSGGAQGAPETMLAALPEILSEAKRRGLRPVPISEMFEGKKNIL
jgi:peptidoglycan/xylan/chitin deacetylase (PgdA/CDA1 family)